ncbi:unnamed protein product [Fraxinus pennsylvanica]|uniref:Uncharacterized protein n=1 Tax=Fraxinus pennsylvanica TaxID=56036 RepID=A0AAD1YKQ7_9LAMI|nr:unnamed protein product [Fraxinus pennsylvanica]
MGSKNDKFVVPSPVKEKTAAVTGGSEEETFFNSQPWLESDCDGDFFSVKGDFASSRGSTPVNRDLVPEGTPNSILEESPSDEKRRLSELFQERIRVDHEEDEPNAAGNKNGVH